MISYIKKGFSEQKMSGNIKLNEEEKSAYERKIGSLQTQLDQKALELQNLETVKGTLESERQAWADEKQTLEQAQTNLSLKALSR